MNKLLKDDQPQNTVHRLRNVFYRLGIPLRESHWSNCLDNFYSVKLSIDNTNLFSNGKGTTTEYALASAYSELIERIQNLVLIFNDNYDANIKNLFSKGFIYTPDEKHFKIKDFIRFFPKKIKDAFLKNDSQDKYFESLLKNTSVLKNKCVCVPYFKIGSKEALYMPFELKWIVYGSNGMAAGNSLEEATVQAISEIFERLVNKEILYDKITPPNISDVFLKQFPKQYNMLKKIENTHNYNIIVKDGTLNKNYPVVIVIFVNKKDMSYFVKLGSHPYFEIALERGLTEFFQGNINSKYFTNFELDGKMAIDCQDNFNKIFIHGNGIYPSNLFSNEFTYEFKEIYSSKYKANDNQTFIKQYYEILKKKGLDLYLRDFSFLGFPTVQAIVPGISEIETFTKNNSFEVINKKTVREIIRKKKYQNKKEYLIMSINYLKKIYENDSSAILNDYIGLYFENNKCALNIPIELILSILLLKNKRVEESYNYIKAFLLKLKKSQSNIDIETYRYYKCIGDVLFLRKENSRIQNKTILSKLNNFYDKLLIEKVIEDLSISNLTKNLPELPCFECNKCIYENKCNYKKVEAIKMSIKEKYYENNIDQNDAKDIIEKIIFGRNNRNENKIKRKEKV